MTTDDVSVYQHKEKAALLLKSYGEDTLSYFHLQDERQYFFSPSGKSFLSFKIFNKVAIVANDPVGETSELDNLFASFLQYIKIWKLTSCFIGLSQSSISILKNYDLKTTKIGEEAIINLVKFNKDLLKKKVKRAVRHIDSLGIEIFFFSPHDIPGFIWTQINEISNTWIYKKGGREKGFSMTLKRLPNKSDKDCIFAVAIKESEVIGFLCFVPAYKSASLSLDQTRKKIDAPNGLNEALIIKSAEYFKNKGIKRISLNFATFSNIYEGKTIIKTTFYKALETLYRCNSLRSFNEKFYPDWENRYAAYTNIRHVPLYLLAILRAER